MFAEQQYTSDVRFASILPSFDLDISNVVHWYEPSGSTRTGCLQSLELVDGIWWGAAVYELTPGFWATENRHAHNFFNGPGAEFALQLNQAVWIAKRGNVWQAAKVSDFYLESGEWFAVLEWHEWFGLSRDEKPLCEVRTEPPALEDDPEYIEFLSKADFWADYEYEDRRDSR